ncbi:hypothetical protein KRM28CT15_46420 [Krasilnikovia sp. M28-CT-15]
MLSRHHVQEVLASGAAATVDWSIRPVLATRNGTTATVSPPQPDLALALDIAPLAAGDTAASGHRESNGQVRAGSDGEPGS